MTIPSSRRTAASLVPLVAAMVIVAATGCTPAPDQAGEEPSRRGAPAAAPTDDSPEAGFARDMATHHAQAVEMAFIVRDATADARLRSLVDDIIVTQSAQRGMFMGWLHLWALPQAAAGPRMAWMADAGDADGHAAHQHDAGGDGLTPMAGMATAADLETLRGATGLAADVLFLQLMIRHHEGGVLMAQAALERSTHEAVATLARGIAASQTGEIETMVGMLADRGAQPMPSLLPAEVDH